MKLKKSIKKKLLIFFVIVIVLIIGYCVYNLLFNNNSKVKESKVVGSISEYGYVLKDNKSKRYKEMFKELKSILSKDDVDYDAYVKKISEMFVYDFYSLNDKSAKTDVGGTDFVYGDILDNFLLNAQSTYYKYVESNIYNQRKQSLPEVDKIKIEDVSNIEYEYLDQSDDNSYKVVVSWDYTSSDFNDYQKECYLIFIHDGKKLSLVELGNDS